VPAKEVSRVLPGASARLLGGADGKDVRLSVTTRPGPAGVSPGADTTVRLTLLEPASYAVDAPVQVDIDLEERANAVLVPAEAVVRTGTQAAVFVAVGDRAERRDVTTGVVDGRRVEITSGLRAGELVITRGHFRLADGAHISVDTTAR
jgi:multidrug efflux pump subunit AcrA (membrane-fusion protein)